MKKNQFYCSILLCLAVLATISSCKKVAEEIVKDPCSDIKFCNVQSYTFAGIGSSYPANTAIFTYDALGNPLTVTNTTVSTGYPNLVFKYNAAHKLTEFYRPYTNGLFETWSKYIYDGSGRIVFDTTFALGTVTPAGPTDYYGARLTTYTYDGTCRVIKTSSVEIGGDGVPFVQEYSYNASGNLVRPGVTYDSKVNIHRTNKIFMFVDRDYSMNNPFTAATYNGYNLPSTISSPGVVNPAIYFLLRPIDNSSFEYKCD
ncbi:MAG: hypothetical protein ABIU63_14070 [Chitinophagaceae bacterium]